MAMKLNALAAALEQYPHALTRFVLPDGNYIPAHAHVTEIGHILKTSIDCGGVTGRSESMVVQAHVGNDTDHRLNSDRFAKILRLGNRVLPHADLDVEVEYDCCVVAQYPITQIHPAGTHLDLLLGRKRTQCLAQERAKKAVAGACNAAASNCC
jgi:hypothetical protein